MQYIAGFSLFQMNPHLAIAVLNILPINNSSRWEKKKVLNVIQSTWLGFNTNLSVIYRKLESQASFTLNGKCALPSCGWSINNTGGLYSPPVLRTPPYLGSYAFGMAWQEHWNFVNKWGAFKWAYGGKFGTQVTETSFLRSTLSLSSLRVLWFSF